VRGSNHDGHINYDEFNRGLQRLGKRVQNDAVFGSGESTWKNKGGGLPGGQMLFNDNLALAREEQVGAPPMVLKHDLGVHTDEPATIQELKGYMGKLKHTIETKYKMMRSAFRSIDEDNCGHISKDELAMAVQHFALPIPLSHIGEIFDHILDVDSDGKVSYNEFTTMIESLDAKWLETEARLQEKRLKQK